jgi:hypothetical protein
MIKQAGGLAQPGFCMGFVQLATRFCCSRYKSIVVLYCRQDPALYA